MKCHVKASWISFGDMIHRQQSKLLRRHLFLTYQTFKTISGGQRPEELWNQQLNIGSKIVLSHLWCNECCLRLWRPSRCPCLKIRLEASWTPRNCQMQMFIRFNNQCCMAIICSRNRAQKTTKVSSSKIRTSKARTGQKLPSKMTLAKAKEPTRMGTFKTNNHQIAPMGPLPGIKMTTWHRKASPIWIPLMKPNRWKVWSRKTNKKTHPSDEKQSLYIIETFYICQMYYSFLILYILN